MTSAAQRDVGKGGGARSGRRGASAGVYRGVDVVGCKGGGRATAAPAEVGGAAPGAGERGVEVCAGGEVEGARPTRGRRARGRGRGVLRRGASDGAARGRVHRGVDVRGRRAGRRARHRGHGGVDVAVVRAGRGAGGPGGGAGGGRGGVLGGQGLVGAPPLGDEEAQVGGADLVAWLGVGREGQVGVGRPIGREALVMLQKTEAGVRGGRGAGRLYRNGCSSLSSLMNKDTDQTRSFL